MCSSFVVMLCAVAVISGLPISQDDGGGGEALKSEGRSKSLEKTICIRYNEKAETNEAADDLRELTDDNSWLLIRLGKSHPKVINYKVLKTEKEGDHTLLDGSNTVSNMTGTEKKVVPTISKCSKISLVNSTNNGSCNNSTSAAVRKTISVLNSTSINDTLSVSESNSTIFNDTTVKGNPKTPGAEEIDKIRNNSSTEGRHGKDLNGANKTYSSESSESTFGKPTYTEDTVASSSNPITNSTNTTVIDSEITKNVSIANDVLPVEEYGSSMEGVSPLIAEKGGRIIGSTEAVINSHDGSDEASNKSMETDEGHKDYANANASANAKRVPGIGNSWVNTFPSEVVTDSYGVVIKVISEEDLEATENSSRARESSAVAVNATEPEYDVWNSTVPPDVLMDEKDLIIGVDTNNSTMDNDFETELFNRTDSNAIDIRNQINENNTNVSEPVDFGSLNATEDSQNSTFAYSRDEDHVFSVTTVDATASTFTYSNISDEPMNGTVGNVSEAMPISVINYEDDVLSDLTNLGTPVTLNDSHSSDESTSTNTPFPATTIPPSDEDGSRPEPAGTPRFPETDIISTNPTTIRMISPAVPLVPIGETESPTTTTLKPTEHNQRLETTTEAHAPPTLRILTSETGGTTDSEILKTQFPSLSSPQKESPDSLVTPSSTNSHSTSELIHRLLPAPSTTAASPEWANFNNFTIIFPTRRFTLVRPYYDPYVRELYYMPPPVDPRHMQPGGFGLYSYN